MSGLPRTTIKLTPKQRAYLDVEIDKARWASYSHALRSLIMADIAREKKQKQAYDWRKKQAAMAAAEKDGV